MSTGEHVRSRAIKEGADSYVVHYKEGGADDETINAAMAKLGNIKDFIKAILYPLLAYYPTHQPYLNAQ